MRWALGRQLLFALGALVLLGAVGGFLYINYGYSAPTCFDGVQNQDEQGIDCDGSCARLCVAPNVSVVWVRSVPVAPGVYHAVAMVRNPDTSSRGTISYEFELFDENNILITRSARTQTLTIGPGEVVPLFEGAIQVGERTPARTFVNITPGVFEESTRMLSSVRVINWELDEDVLRLTATVANQGEEAVDDVSITALLFNSADTLVAASQTLTGSLAAEEQKVVVFTWQEPFSEPITRSDILPRVLEVR